MPDVVNILIMDADPIVAELLSDYLERNGMRGTLTHRQDGNKDIVARTADYDAILLDPTAPGMNTPRDLEQMVRTASPKPVILFAGRARREIIEHALEVGARGYIPKSATLRTLLNAIRFVLAGETFVPASFLSSPSERITEGGLNLSAKELEVLRQIRLGRMNKEIAQSLGLSLVSVKMHVRAVCGKLSAKNRTQAALLASQLLPD